MGKFECSARYDKDEKTIIVIAIGINDTQNIDGIDKVSIEEFENNIKQLIKKARRFTDLVCFIGLTRVDEPSVKDRYSHSIKKNKSYFNDKIIRFDDLLEKTCDFNKVLYIKMFNLLDINDLSDGLHPNNTGHEKICSRILDNFKKLL